MIEYHYIADRNGTPWSGRFDTMREALNAKAEWIAEVGAAFGLHIVTERA